MADDEEMDIDPAIAEAMGFSGFGTKPGNKRKFDMNDAFIDRDASKGSKAPKGQGQGQGINEVPVGSRKMQEGSRDGDVKGGTVSGSVDAKAHMQDKNSHVGEYDLQALRYGVKNERGDTVFFLPSFIEDPWTYLKPH